MNTQSVIAELVARNSYLEQRLQSQRYWWLRRLWTSRREERRLRNENTELRQRLAALGEAMA
ncbi:hypothetical protein [Mailhella massiliensis]|uniref:hypothetical protein n=1 Tax=Mailhella massiliensis TaxID=1903261 RepID=UPI00097D0E9A|nr:hypothetical protein [Mailhella massiliensis]